MVVPVPTLLRECRDCGHFHILGPIPGGSTARCVRCGVSGRIHLARLMLLFTSTVMLCAEGPLQDRVRLRYTKQQSFKPVESNGRISRFLECLYFYTHSIWLVFIGIMRIKACIIS
jgi:hypothetical protein